MDCDTALRRLSIPDDTVCGAYVVGSRLWGTASEKSDWDVIIVTQSNGTAAESPLLENRRCREIDAMVMSVDVFTKRLQEHHFKEMCTLWLPEHCILRNRLDLAKKFCLDKVTLSAQVLGQAQHDWKRVEKYIKDRGDKASFQQGKKTALAVLRELTLCLQLATTGTISDMGAANDIQEELQYFYTADWDLFDAEYGSRYRALCDDLALACDT
eukprot:TRINITY_DN29429_c0_g1_i1.p1 TRINITY_DN29429_c0_g1~~TRINITY_DN29429_c0_g1_i1.p1  ORF type:complete len:235 (-),score=46.77 TRINITY_DN29429_c0_g1_i1:504-1142(-)